MIDAILRHLGALIEADTTNPPRAITARHAAVTHAATALERAGFDAAVRDLGGGCVSVLATRGSPSLLVNCHLDTVPAGEGWTRPPMRLTVDGSRAYGRGACDIKGAAACLLAAAEATTGDAAILLTTDEEGGAGRCIPDFLARSPRWDGVIVAEPTRCRGVTAHRGLIAVEARFRGVAAHSANAGAVTGSAVHAAVRWAGRALDWAAAQPDDHRLNLGVIEGGEKTNVVGPSARVRLGLRPPPDADGAAVLAALRALDGPAPAEWDVRFNGPGLRRDAHADTLLARLGADDAGAVDFWTEASLFARAGLPAIVFGPGDIRHAHAPDESVELDQLRRAARAYADLFA